MQVLIILIIHHQRTIASEFIMCRRRATAHLICMRIIFAHTTTLFAFASRSREDANKYINTNRPPDDGGGSMCFCLLQSAWEQQLDCCWVHSLSLCLCATDRFQSNRFWLIRCAAVSSVYCMQTPLPNQFVGCAPTRSNKSLFSI